MNAIRHKDRIVEDGPEQIQNLEQASQEIDQNINSVQELINKKTGNIVQLKQKKEALIQRSNELKERIRGLTVEYKEKQRKIEEERKKETLLQLEKIFKEIVIGWQKEQIERDKKILQDKLIELKNKKNEATYHLNLVEEQKLIEAQLIKEENEELEKIQRIKTQRLINKEKDPKKHKRLMERFFEDEDKKLLKKIWENLKILRQKEEAAHPNGFMKTLLEYKEEVSKLEKLGKKEKFETIEQKIEEKKNLFEDLSQFVEEANLLEKTMQLVKSIKATQKQENALYLIANELGIDKNKLQEAFKITLSQNQSAGPAIPSLDSITDKTKENRSEDLGRRIEDLASGFPRQIRDYYISEFNKITKKFKQIVSKFSKEQIRTESERIRALGNDEIDIPFVIALMWRANQIITGFNLRPAQILAVLEFEREGNTSKFCQINTGEGKTTVTALLAVLNVLKGSTVDIITSNEVLAEIAAKEKETFYALFGLSVSNNSVDVRHVSGPKPCYKADIVYGTISCFEFDYLKHRVKRMNNMGKRSPGTLIIDEADNVILDNAAHIAKLSDPISGMEHITQLHINIFKRLVQIEKETNLSEEETKNKEELTEKLKIHFNKQKLKQNCFIPFFLKKYVDEKLDVWISNCIKARYFLHEDQNYIIRKKEANRKKGDAEDMIICLDMGVGVTLQNTLWTDLHPFVQIKHNLQISPEGLTSIYISNCSYIKLYYKVMGLSGTLGSKREKNLIFELYNAKCTVIPTYKKTEMIEEDNLLVEDSQHDDAVIEDIMYHSDQGRSTLLICPTVDEVKKMRNKIEEFLTVKEKKKLITYLDETEAQQIEYINKAGGLPCCAVIIATNIGGRGTDIKLSKELLENGGLHVCLSYLPPNSRIVKQALGRAARQGEPGSCRLIIKRAHLTFFTNKEIFFENGEILFTNEEIYAFIDEFEEEKLRNSETQIEIISQKGRIFNKFAEKYTKLKAFRVNSYILDDMKLGWAFYNEKIGEIELKAVFKKFDTCAASVNSYFHTFMNPNYALKYAEGILSEGEVNEAGQDLTASKCNNILDQECIAEDSSFHFASHMKRFELAMHEGNVLVESVLNFIGKIIDFFGGNSSNANQYKEKSLKHLILARECLMERVNRLKNELDDPDFANILLEEENLDNEGENCMLKHLSSKHALLVFSLEQINYLIDFIEKNKGPVFIKMRHSLKELLGLKEYKEEANCILPEEQKFAINAVEDCFFELDTLKMVGWDHPKIKAGLAQIGAGIASLALNAIPILGQLAASALSNILISNGIFDIVSAFLGDEEIDLKSKLDDYLIDALTFGIGKIMKVLKVLHRIGKYIGKSISVGKKVIFAGKMFAKVGPRINKFAKKLAKLRPQKISKFSVKKLFKEGAKKVVKAKILEEFGSYFQDEIREFIRPIVHKVFSNILEKQFQKICDKVNEMKELLKSFVMKKVEKVFDKLEKAANEQGLISLDDIRKEYDNLIQIYNGVTANITEVISCVGLIHQSSRTLIHNFKYVLKPLMKDIKAKKPLGVVFHAREMKEKVELSIQNINLIIDEVKRIIEENSIHKLKETLSSMIETIENLLKMMLGYDSMISDFRKFFMKKLNEKLTFDNNPIENYLRKKGIDLKEPQKIINFLTDKFLKKVETFLVNKLKKKFSRISYKKDENSQNGENVAEFYKNSYENDCVYQAIKIMLELDNIEQISTATGVYLGEKGVSFHQSLLVLKLLGFRKLEKKILGKSHKEELVGICRKLKSLGGIVFASNKEKGHAYLGSEEGKFKDKSGEYNNLGKYQTKITVMAPNFNDGERKKLVKNIKNTKAPYLLTTEEFEKEVMYGNNNLRRRIPEFENDPYTFHTLLDIQKVAELDLQGNSLTLREFHDNFRDNQWINANNYPLEKALGDLDKFVILARSLVNPPQFLYIIRYKRLLFTKKCDRQLHNGILSYNCPYVESNSLDWDSLQRNYTEIALRPGPNDPKIVTTVTFAGCTYYILRTKNSIKLWHDSKPLMNRNDKINRIKQQGMKLIMIEHIDFINEQIPGEITFYHYNDLTTTTIVLIFDERLQQWEICSQSVMFPVKVDENGVYHRLNVSGSFMQYIT